MTVSIRDQESLDQAITDAVARNLAIALEAKDLTAAIKAAIDWRKEKYGVKDGDEKWGSKLNPKGGEE